MDYTPINARRVLFAVGLTMVIGLVPASFCFLYGSNSISLGFASQSLVLMGGSVVLAVLLTASLIVTVRLGQRLLQRPLRA